MVLTLSEVSGSLQDRFHGGDTEGREGGLLRASANFVAESFAGGMAFRSKRSAVCSESPTTSHGSTLSVSSMMSTSPSKPSVMNASSVCSKPIPIGTKKHGSHTDKGQFHTLIDAMRAQSPPHLHSLHGDTPEAFDLEAAVYKNWLVSNFALYFRQSYFFHIEALTSTYRQYVGLSFFLSRKYSLFM